MAPRFTFLWLFALLTVGSAQADDDPFFAGCAIVDISPRALPAICNGGFVEQSHDRIDDPLHARCLALSDGKTTIVLAIVDSCMIPRDVCDAIKMSVARRANIAASNILIAATHTHSAPSVMDFCLGSRKDSAYADQLIPQVAEGIATAVSRLKPARLGWCVVRAPEHTHCRRWLKHPSAYADDPFGQRTVRAMMHPGYQNPEYVGPAGPVDDQLSLISVQSSNGRPVCLLANYSMHYFGAGSAFSADYFGDFAGMIEDQIQPQKQNDEAERFLAIMSQGTSGDQHWMNYQLPARTEYSRQKYSAELAQLALDGLENIEYRTDLTLGVAATTVGLSRRTPGNERLAWAGKLNEDRGDRRPVNLPEVYAEQAAWLRENPQAELVLQVIRIGELGIAAIPNEVFGITGLKLKAQSPLQPLINFELANGAEGYIPPPEQHAIGGYTTWPARTAGLEVDAEPKIVGELLTLLEQVSGGRTRHPLTTDFYDDIQRRAIATAKADDNNRENQSADWQLHLRYRVPTSSGSGRFHTLTRAEDWSPAKTAIIVCDVWDSHHSLNAVRRVGELAPRIDRLLKLARAQGATIIHAPSDCMESYTEHPARHRAMSAPANDGIPAEMTWWRSRIDSEVDAVYPLDQSDGGDDDDPAEHAEWVKELESQGRKTGTPWLAQSPLIAIDPDHDYISDNGDEVWNILRARGIDNVILVGVHTNMCVLGRPFGLRNMVAAGKKVALVRDLTDTMYNPQRWPFVNHHTGTDRVIEYIEKHVCPTITGDQLLGGAPLRYASDTRPLVAIVMAEDEYETNQTLPRFAEDCLGNDFRVALVFGSDSNPNEIPGLEILDEADAAIFSVRRRPLPPAQMAIVRRFVQSGKPVLGIRTASHAFAPRDSTLTDGLEAWPTFDAEVFGGNYSGHHGEAALPMIDVVPESSTHSILAEVDFANFSAGGSLYKTSPLAGGAFVLLHGAISGQPTEPVAWIFERAGGGRSFYTSLGHKNDFESGEFRRLLYNAICWATGQKSKGLPDTRKRKDAVDDYWRVVDAPTALDGGVETDSAPNNSDGWYRCYFRADDLSGETLLTLPSNSGISAFVNGEQLEIEARSDGGGQAIVPIKCMAANDLNLLVIRLHPESIGTALVPPISISLGNVNVDLRGKWQFRRGDDPSFATIPLPAKFAASTDVIFPQ